MHAWLWDRRCRPFASNNPVRRNLIVLNHTIQFWSPKRESTRAGNVSCDNRIVSLAVWHVASSRRNHVSAASISSNFGRKNLVIASRYRAPLTVAARPASFSKKYGPMTPPGQNPHQTATRRGCVCFSLIARGFSEPQTQLAILAIDKGIEAKMCFVA